jgi:hypothetical protein
MPAVRSTVISAGTHAPGMTQNLQGAQTKYQAYNAIGLSNLNNYLENRNYKAGMLINSNRRYNRRYNRSRRRGGVRKR